MTHKPGRPAYTPTEKDRASVKTMSASGIPDYDLAKVIGTKAQRRQGPGDVMHR